MTVPPQTRRRATMAPLPRADSQFLKERFQFQYRGVVALQNEAANGEFSWPAVMEGTLNDLTANHPGEFLTNLGGKLLKTPDDCFVYQTSNEKLALDDIVDTIHPTALPLLGYQKSHSISVTKTLKGVEEDTEIQITSHTIEASKTTYNQVLTMVSRMKNVTGIQLDSAVNHETALIPLAVSTIDVFSQLKISPSWCLHQVHLSEEQQEAFSVCKTILKLDRCTLDDDGRTLYQQASKLKLVFKDAKSLNLPLITAAVKAKRVISLTIQDTMLHHGQEADLKKLVKASDANGCELVLEDLVHATLKGNELLSLFADMEISPGAFKNSRDEVDGDDDIKPPAKRQRLDPPTANWAGST